LVAAGGAGAGGAGAGSSMGSLVAANRNEILHGNNVYMKMSNEERAEYNKIMSADVITMDGFKMKVGNCYVFTNEDIELIKPGVSRYGGEHDPRRDIRKRVYKTVVKKRNPSNNTYDIYVEHNNGPKEGELFEVAAKLEKIEEQPTITRYAEGEHHSIERILHFRLDTRECNRLPHSLSAKNFSKATRAADAAWNSAGKEGGTLAQMRAAVAAASASAFAEAQAETEAANSKLEKVKKCMYRLAKGYIYNTSSRFKIVSEIPCDDLNARFQLFAGGERKRYTKTKKARRNRRRFSKRN
jgi:hypothetical protein